VQQFDIVPSSCMPSGMQHFPTFALLVQQFVELPLSPEPAERQVHVPPACWPEQQFDAVLPELIVLGAQQLDPFTVIEQQFDAPPVAAVPFPMHAHAPPLTLPVQQSVVSVEPSGAHAHWSDAFA